MPYGIRDEVWNKLPLDDRAAIAATAKGKPPPAIGGYTPHAAAPAARAATSAPPPNLSAGVGLRTGPTGDYPLATQIVTPTRATVGMPLADGRALASWTLASREAQVGRIVGGGESLLGERDGDGSGSRLSRGLLPGSTASSRPPDVLRPFVAKRGPAKGTDITANDIHLVEKLRDVDVEGIRGKNSLRQHPLAFEDVR